MLKPAKYEKAKIIGLEEAMGITDAKKEEVNKELNEFLNIDNIIGMHGDVVSMLKGVDRHLDEYVSDYEKKGKKDREPVEAAYSLKINMLDKLAVSFNPLSLYGKKRLEDAVKCRKEFEAVVGPMITKITPNNIDLFKTVLCPGIREDIISGRRNALGALRTYKKTTYGVAAIVYHRETSAFYENGRLAIDWLFVNSKFRGRRISHFLIGELINSAAQNGIEEIYVEFSKDLPESKLLNYVFGVWNFELDTGISSDAEMRMVDITGFKEIKEKNKGAKAFSALGSLNAPKLMRDVLSRFGHKGYLISPSLPEGYIDYDLSFYMGKETDVSSILVTHRTVTGLVRVEFLESAPGKEEEEFNLIAAFLETAIKTCGDEEIAVIPVEAEEIGEFLEKICSRQTGLYLLSGSLNKPSPEADLTQEDLEEALAVLDQE